MNVDRRRFLKVSVAAGAAAARARELLVPPEAQAHPCPTHPVRHRPPRAQEPKAPRLGSGPADGCGAERLLQDELDEAAVGVVSRCHDVRVGLLGEVRPLRIPPDAVEDLV